MQWHRAAEPVGPADQVRAVHLGDLLDHAIALDAEVHGLAGGLAEPVQERLGDIDQAGLGPAAPRVPDEHLAGPEPARGVPADQATPLQREQQP